MGRHKVSVQFNKTHTHSMHGYLIQNIPEDIYIYIYIFNIIYIYIYIYI